MLLAFSTSLVMIGVVLGLFTISMRCFGIAALTYQMEVTPDALRGRVGTAFSLLIWTATPVGGAAVGLLLDAVSPRTTSLVFAAWVLLLCVASTWSGALRGLDKSSEDGERSA